MIDTHLPLLCCPACRGALEFEGFDTEELPEGRESIREGLARCPDCGVYPVIDGVPRFMNRDLAQYPDFVGRRREILEALCPEAIPARSAPVPEDDFENIRDSFTEEWAYFDYGGDKTWGWTLEERKQVFLGDMELQPEALEGKRLLDAGCGNGSMTAALSGLGLDIIGLDLNQGLSRAERHKADIEPRAAGHVSYAQGNLFEPPVRDGAVDFLYSSGVIHHTPDSRATLSKLVPLVAPGGRLYVWVYRRRAWPVTLFFACGRALKRFIGLRALLRVCRALSYPYKLGADLLSAAGLVHFRKRSTREITLDLFDAFSPRYNHCHSHEEVMGWFREFGFENIAISGVQKHGFGCHGDKPLKQD